MDKDTKYLVLYGGGFALLYFGVIRPILKKLSIVPTPQTKIVEDLTKLANKDNPFSPVFLRSIKGGTPLTLLKVASSTQLVKNIYDAMGYFSDDEAAVFSAFKSLKTQAQCSQISTEFVKTHQVDMIEFLKKGKGVFPQAGLNDVELADIIQTVLKLPKYK
jgi:hypothetical protein